MTPSHLRTLVAVAEHRSFSRAAIALGQGQPTVSRTIRQLERNLGGALLTRGADGAVPTALGEEALRHARIALRELDALRDLAADAGAEPPPGPLRVAVPPSLATWPMPLIFGAMRRRYPQVRVRLFEGPPEDLRTWLETHMVDAALHTVPAEGWQWHPFAREPFDAVLPGRTAPASIGLKEMAGLPLILSDCGIEVPLRTAFAAQSLGMEVLLRTRSYTTIFAMIEEGLGVTLLPRSLARGAPPSLAHVPVEDGPVRQIGLLLPEAPGRRLVAFRREVEATLSGLHAQA